jgi:hypothetical protein
MDWIFDNFQFVIAIAAAFAWWLNKRRESTAEEDEGEAPPPLAPHGHDAEAEARARRIQEEIRRKIAERRTLPPVATPPIEIPQWQRSEHVPEPPPLVVEQRYDPAAAVLEQQRLLTERLRAVDAARQKAAAIRVGAPRVNLPATVTAVAQNAKATSLAASLRNLPEVRRAILMREILGTPKGLQG